jgi:hypothetical protein
MKPIKGKQVTTSESVEAYYSNYGGLPPCSFNPGDVGVISEVNVPCVRKNGVFNCVDFEKNGQKWRVALTNSQLRPV